MIERVAWQAQSLFAAALAVNATLTLAGAHPSGLSVAVLACPLGILLSRVLSSQR